MHGLFYLEYCRKNNMDSSENWVNTASMLRSHGEQWTFNSIGNKAYALGGWRYKQYDVEWLEEFDGVKWSYKASFPYSIYRHCPAADEETGRLWVTGGTYHDGKGKHEKRDVHYYEVTCFVVSLFWSLQYTKFLPSGLHQHLAQFWQASLSPPVPAHLRHRQDDIQ